MLPSILRVDGKIENILSDEDFARLLRDKLGDDAERYFRDALRHHSVYPDDDFDYAKCPGECDKTYEIQESYERLLNEIRDEVASWRTRYLTKDKIDSLRMQLIDRINREM